MPPVRHLARPTIFFSMNISPNAVVTLTYKLFSAGGEVIEESTQPISYLHGGHQGIFTKVGVAVV